MVVDQCDKEEKIQYLDLQIEELDRQIFELERQRASLYKERESTLIELEADKMKDHYEETLSEEWSVKLNTLAKEHWGIDAFRPLQEPILTAALAQKRDIFVVLPTGGGKSLCYQLPALVQKGFALVVSPLVSLIQDQVYDLHKAGVPAAMLTSATPRSIIKEVEMAMKTGEQQEDLFKLVYVTPEKIAKSKLFMKALKAAYDANRLSRIIIDEAHCCSQHGHDFRPDYRSLRILRNEFPNVPIMALTATCPWKVMQDVINILGLPSPHQDKGTLVYSAPLFRPNLRYCVVPKPDTPAGLITDIVQWILKNHKNQTGIIYCLSRKDTESVAAAINMESKGKIACAAYHADLDSDERELVHSSWRGKIIHVVVATIAFGMGINHLETRYIIHHSISKSMENYYQESGRAGRDGKPADCVIYYRGQDAPRISTLVGGKINEAANLYRMIQYAQDYKTCRKIAFENYLTVDPTLFGGTTPLVNQITPDQPCGICDNCTRDTDDIVMEDITMLAVSLVRLCRALRQAKERATMNKIVQLLQGRKLTEVHLEHLKGDNDFVDIALGKLYTPHSLEHIVSYLTIEQYLMEEIRETIYLSYSYVVEGPRAHEIYNLDKEDILAGTAAVSIKIPLLQANSKGNSKAKQGAKRRRKTGRQPKVNLINNEPSQEVIVIEDDETPLV